MLPILKKMNTYRKLCDLLMDTVYAKRRTRTVSSLRSILMYSGIQQIAKQNVTKTIVFTTLICAWDRIFDLF